MARVPAEATGFAHRTSRTMATVASFDDGPEDKSVHQAWVEEFAVGLRQDDGAYVGFLGEDRSARVRQAHPGPTWDRLVQVKPRYDPGNLFHHNHNIPPATKEPRQ